MGWWEYRLLSKLKMVVRGLCKRNKAEQLEQPGDLRFERKELQNRNERMDQ